MARPSKWTKAQDDYLREFAGLGKAYALEEVKPRLIQGMATHGPARTWAAIRSRMYLLGIADAIPASQTSYRWTHQQLEFLKAWMATAPAGTPVSQSDLDHIATLGPPRTRTAVEAKVNSLKIVKGLRRTAPARPAAPAKSAIHTGHGSDLGLLLAIAGVDPEALEAALGRAWVLGLLPDGFTRDQGLGVIERARKAYEELWA